MPLTRSTSLSCGSPEIIARMDGEFSNRAKMYWKATEACLRVGAMTTT